MDSTFRNSGKSYSGSSRQSHATRKVYDDKSSKQMDTSPVSHYKKNCESYFSITVEYIPRINNKRSYAGPNRLYNYKRKAFFYLFDMTSWTIYTNNHRFNKNVKTIKSTSKNPNKRFRISALLTAFFFRQNFIPNRARNKYFSRIRQLLLDKDEALTKRKEKDLNNKRNTTTFIRFGYKRRSIYFGIYIPCKKSKCPLPCAKVLSQGRNKCADHIKEYYQEITTDSNNRKKGKEKQETIHKGKDYMIKKVWSNRLGIKYDKYGKWQKRNASEQPIKTDNFTLQGEIKPRQRQRLKRFLKKNSVGVDDNNSFCQFYSRRNTHEKYLPQRKATSKRSIDKDNKADKGLKESHVKATNRQVVKEIINQPEYDIQPDIREKGLTSDQKIEKPIFDIKTDTRMKELAIDREVERILNEPSWVNKSDEELNEIEKKLKLDSEIDDEFYDKFINDSTWPIVANRVMERLKQREQQVLINREKVKDNNRKGKSKVKPVSFNRFEKEEKEEKKEKIRNECWMLRPVSDLSKTQKQKRNKALKGKGLTDKEIEKYMKEETTEWPKAIKDAIYFGRKVDRTRMNDD